MNGNLNMNVMNMPGMNMNMAGMNNNNNNNQAMAAMMQNQNFGNPLMQQPQIQQQQPLPQQGVSQRPGMHRAATIQQGNPVTGQAPMAKMGQFSPNGIISGPNSAPIPGTGNNSAGTSQGHTPQMGNQPQPPLQGQFPPQFPQQPVQQGQKINGGPINSNVTPIVPQQQQPTPQSQPRPGMPQQKQNMPMQGQIQGGQLHSPMQKQPIANSPQFFRNQEQEQMQNELNAKIFKRNLGNAGVIRILNLIDQISNESYENLSKLGFWQKVIQLYCVPSCTVRLTTAPSSNASKSANHKFTLDAQQHTLPRQFELNVLTAPRFFLAQILSGQVSKLSITLPGLKFQVMNNSSIFIISRLSIQYNYADGSVSNVTGTFKMLMNREFRIEWIDCQCSNIQSSVNFETLERQWANFSQSQHENDRKEEDDQSQQEFPKYLRQSSTAIASSDTCGLHEDAFRVLQIGDVMSHLRALMGFSTANNISSPMKSLELFMSVNNNQQPQNIQPQNKMNSNDPSKNGTSPSPNMNT
ncbi:uncharacterized protein AC631_03025 [Debaryomyces fabryi]|uniref:Morphogenetic regulator of filamentous growth protein 1 n=1 Tax=Debaryomyces fabryi TaxID=58627 RepID=A0A0V1PYF0_9ASCO|nr:uncharacterized protein AC631_03025 [Debaryomyces fabryi]KSA01206.1 hypothetical protein AC631_03025 [Debaryomyces fabryi]